jgi:N6-adenosine-specific RNA methylase IME4
MDYSMMEIDEIKNLPVHSIADIKCICFIWTIDKYLYQTPSVLNSWGFKYHLTMAWDKTNGLAMYGFNRQTEFIVVGLKGKHNAYPKRATIRTSFAAKSPYHSAKPDAFYWMLDGLPYNPRIDLFARKQRQGLFIKNQWDVWGNEV